MVTIAFVRAKRRRVSYVSDQTAILALGNCKKYFSAPLVESTFNQSQKRKLVGRANEKHTE